MEDFKLNLSFGPWLSHMSRLKVPLTLSSRKERPDIFCRVLSLIASGIMKCLKKEGKPGLLCMIEGRGREVSSVVGGIKS